MRNPNARLPDLRIPYGVCARRELLDAGISKVEIERALRFGDLSTLRHGWYATAWADVDVAAAVRAGGALSCVSVLRRLGVWVPPGLRHIHVRAGKNANSTLGGGRFCRQYGRPEPVARAVDDLPIAFRHALRCLDAEGIVVVCDSILNSELLTEAELRWEMGTAPKRVQALLDLADCGAQSGTETVTRLRLRALGIAVRTQFYIAGVGAVDLLVGTCLILELDSRLHHTDSAAYEQDRRRDRESARLGYRTLRFSYRQVMYEWPSVLAAIRAVIDRREHRRSPQ